MHITLSDAAELAAEISAQDGIPLDEALAMAQRHIDHLTREAAAPTLRTLLNAAEREARPMLEAQARRRWGK